MYICFRCRKHFDKANLLIAHLKTDHLMSTKFLKVQCVQDNCKQTFTKFTSFRIHLEKLHKNHTKAPPMVKAINVPVEMSSSKENDYTNSETVINNNTIEKDLNVLKKKTLYLSLQLHGQSYMPRNHVIEIQHSVSILLSSISCTIEKYITDHPNYEDLRYLLNFCKNPFEETRTEYRLLKILKELNFYDDPKVYVISNQVSEIVISGNPSLGPKLSNIYIMPLKFMISALFKIPNLLDLTLENSKKFLNSPVLQNFTNGELYKTKLLKYQYNLVIPYVLYMDDFQINNPLGTHTFSICGCYISFPSMPQHLLSKLDYILTAAFIPSKDLKERGNEVSFHNLVEELKILEEGVEICVQQSVQKVHFILGVIIGDNLAVNSILGYVQSFNSKRFCRVCRRKKSQMQFDAIQHLDSLRNQENYNSNVLENNFQETGIKNKCIFESLPNFNVTENFCFDIMHDIFEGICVYDMSNVILGLIQENIVTLDCINSRKSLFQFGEIEVGNKSGPLDLCRLKNYNLKMTASETMCFTNFLPLMVGDLIPFSNDHWKVFIILLQIIDLLLRPSYIEDDLIKLEELIRDHHSLYITLYGSLKPKHHFLVHYPTAIRKCGPLKYLWSMRFEAKHKEAKAYLGNTTSRVNPCRSLSIKSGLKFSNFLLKHEDNLEPNVIINTHTIEDLAKEEYCYKKSKPVLNYQNCKVSDDIFFKGTRYKKNYYLATNNAAIELFKIKHLIIENENVYILCNQVKVKNFDYHLQSYEVGSLNEDTIFLIPILDFITYPFHLYPMNNGKVYFRFKLI